MDRKLTRSRDAKCINPRRGNTARTLIIGQLAGFPHPHKGSLDIRRWQWLVKSPQSAETGELILFHSRSRPTLTIGGSSRIAHKNYSLIRKPRMKEWKLS